MNSRLQELARRLVDGTRMLARHLARRLADGSGILTRRLADRAAAWIRKGRRDDLEGLAAVLGCILRALLALLGLYLLWRLIRAFPNLLWLIVPLWCWRAIRAAPPATAEPKQPDEAVPAASSMQPVLALLYRCLANRDAVHLSEVLRHLQSEGQGEGWTVTDLRVRLEALGIPVTPKVKAGGRGPTRGVRRADLPPLPDVQETAPSPTTSTAA